MWVLVTEKISKKISAHIKTSILKVILGEGASGLGLITKGVTARILLYYILLGRRIVCARLISMHARTFIKHIHMIN